MCPISPNLKFYDNIINFLKKNPEIAALGFTERNYRGNVLLISNDKVLHVSNVNSVIIRGDLELTLEDLDRRNGTTFHSTAPLLLPTMSHVKEWYADANDGVELGYISYGEYNKDLPDIDALGDYEVSLAHDPFERNHPETSWEEVRKTLEKKVEISNAAIVGFSNALMNMQQNVHN